jgi:hypothetical protein
MIARVKTQFKLSVTVNCGLSPCLPVPYYNLVSLCMYTLCNPSHKIKTKSESCVFGKLKTLKIEEYYEICSNILYIYIYIYTICSNILYIVYTIYSIYIHIYYM